MIHGDPFDRGSCGVQVIADGDVEGRHGAGQPAARHADATAATMRSVPLLSSKGGRCRFSRSRLALRRRSPGDGGEAVAASVGVIPDKG